MEYYVTRTETSGNLFCCFSLERGTRTQPFARISLGLKRCRWIRTVWWTSVYERSHFYRFALIEFIWNDTLLKVFFVAFISVNSDRQRLIIWFKYSTKPIKYPLTIYIYIFNRKQIKMLSENQCWINP